ncbi:ABC transporter ATP-binding protein [Actinomycetaceae bacterium L2_0104]
MRQDPSHSLRTTPTPSWRSSTEDDIILATRHVTKSFGSERGHDRIPVLRGIDMEVPRGALVSIVGPSGCGKSTLLFCLSGLDRPDSGELLGFDADMLSFSPAQLARLYRTRIGFVFQSSNLVGSLTAWENTILPTSLRRGKVDEDRVRGVLTDLGILESAGVRASDLSNGQQQRVALARVLIQQPEVIFADEPTGALDSSASETVLDLLCRYPGDDRSVVMVTHDIAAACRSDLVFVMRDGVMTHRVTQPSPEFVLAAMEENL